MIVFLVQTVWAIPAEDPVCETVVVTVPRASEVDVPVDVLPHVGLTGLCLTAPVTFELFEGTSPVFQESWDPGVDGVDRDFDVGALNPSTAYEITLSDANGPFLMVPFETGTEATPPIAAPVVTVDTLTANALTVSFDGGLDLASGSGFVTLTETTFGDVFVVEVIGDPMTMYGEVRSDDFDAEHCLVAVHRDAAGQVSPESAPVCGVPEQVEVPVPEPESDGCGCASAAPVGLWATLALVPLALSRRRGR